jgi:hypothetical protein
MSQIPHSFSKYVAMEATKPLLSRSERTKNLFTSSFQGQTNNQNKGVNNEIYIRVLFVVIKILDFDTYK